jgi:L-amino acid N-acyltransferase YncA
MLIRDADSKRDAAACAAIYAPFVRDTPISLEERVPTAEEIAQRIDITKQTHPWLVAEDQAELIGYAYATRHRERACYRWAADVTVYVAPHSQRRGVGRALYTALFEALTNQGFRIACAGITLPNQASVGLHESLGFQPVGVYRNIGWKFDTWYDVGWWQLELSPAGGEPQELSPPPRRAT